MSFKTSLGMLATAVAVGAQYCDLPAKPQWAASPDGPLAQPMHNWTSLKDFTHVPYKGQHLVYGSNVNNSTYGSMNFGLFTNWADMATASQNGMNSPTVAPTLFYHAPASIWVMAYQWGGHSFSYRTSTDPTNANGWGPEQALYDGGATGAPYGPIDQTVIADDTNMWLFFAGDNGQIYRASMPLGNFPGNFGTTFETILNDTTANLFEAVQVYKLKGQTKWLMMVECEGAVGRYFRSFTATNLGGKFTELSGLESNPFAGKANTAITWSAEISHGDLIRSTNDQTFEIDPCNLEFLIQGRGPSTAPYNDLPWRPALLSLVNPEPMQTGGGSSSSASSSTTFATSTITTSSSASATAVPTTCPSATATTVTVTSAASTCPTGKTSTVTKTTTEKSTKTKTTTEKITKTTTETKTKTTTEKSTKTVTVTKS